MPKMIHEELLCCGSKRCPTVRIFEDCSMEISDDDSEIGSVGVVKLSPEAVKRIVEIAQKAPK